MGKYSTVARSCATKVYRIIQQDLFLPKNLTYASRTRPVVFFFARRCLQVIGFTFFCFLPFNVWGTTNMNVKHCLTFLTVWKYFGTGDVSKSCINSNRSGDTLHIHDLVATHKWLRNQLIKLSKNEECGATTNMGASDLLACRPMMRTRNPKLTVASAFENFFKYIFKIPVIILCTTRLFVRFHCKPTAFIFSFVKNVREPRASFKRPYRTWLVFFSPCSAHEAFEDVSFLPGLHFFSFFRQHMWYIFSLFFLATWKIVLALLRAP